MASPLADKFGGKKRTPKFADDGPPSGADESRGAGGKADEDTKMSSSMPPSSDDDAPDMGDGPDSPDDPMAMGGDPEEQAADDLADIIGVGPDDREDFGNALQAYVSACIAKNMAPAPDMGMPDMGGGPEAPGGSPPPIS